MQICRSGTTSSLCLVAWEAATPVSPRENFPIFCLKGIIQPTKQPSPPPPQGTIGRLLRLTLLPHFKGNRDSSSGATVASPPALPSEASSLSLLATIQTESSGVAGERKRPLLSFLSFSLAAKLPPPPPLYFPLLHKGRRPPFPPSLFATHFFCKCKSALPPQPTSEQRGGGGGESTQEASSVLEGKAGRVLQICCRNEDAEEDMALL